MEEHVIVTIDDITMATAMYNKSTTLQYTLEIEGIVVASFLHLFFTPLMKDSTANPT